MDTQLLGAAGEYYAARYYREHGYLILSTNFKTRFGELDIVAQKKDLVVIAEVKLRKKGAMVSGAQAVTPAKQRKVILATQAYLQKAELLDANIRFDVIEVEHENDIFEVKPILGAFEMDDSM